MNKVALAYASVAFVAFAVFFWPSSRDIPLDDRGRAPASSGERGLAAAGSLDHLIRESSDAGWKVKRGRPGTISMSEGALPLGSRAPAIAAAEFLEKYSLGVLGVPADQLELDGVRQDSVTSRAMFRQKRDGLTIYGAGLTLYFDREGSLVHLNALLQLDSFPAPSAGIDGRVAARAARDELVRALTKAGDAIAPENYSVEVITASGSLAYRLESGSVNLVYRFQIPLEGQSAGEAEVFVDARSGSASLRLKSKN